MRRMTDEPIAQDGLRSKRPWAAPAIADETPDAGRGTNKTSNSQAFDGHFTVTINFATVS